MPSRTLDPSSEQSPQQRASPPKPPKLDTFDYRTTGAPPYPSQDATSPVAPEFSPITPPTKPAFPAIYIPQADATQPPPNIDTNSNNHASHPPEHQDDAVTPAAPPSAEYIPAPPPQPFSGEDATDAIALRAAISSLQFQKSKAQDDIRTLEKLRKKALEEPENFKAELAAGRLKEDKPKVGDLQAVLDEEDSGEGDDDEIVFGSENETEKSAKKADSMDLDAAKPSDKKSPNSTFDRIPGPQNIIRTPYVNWEKYHITGAPLDQLHEQQRKWPGQAPFGHDRGREYAVAAPYSPWLDTLEAQASHGEQRWERNDSGPFMTPISGMTPTGSISEHPMETRRRTNQ